MRLQQFKKYAIGAGGMLVLVAAIVLANGSGSAVAAQITSVFVTNTSAHPVPVSQQGTANVAGSVTARPAPPDSTWSVAGFMEGSNLLPAGPSSTPIDLTSLTVSPRVSGDSGSFLAELGRFTVADTATDCTGAVFDRDFWVASDVSASLAVAFPTPLQVRVP